MIKTTSSHTIKLSEIDPKLAGEVTKARAAPGPWRASFTDTGSKIRDKDGELLFQSPTHSYGALPTTKMEADAKLAAQAPTLKAQNEELLDALKWAYNFAELLEEKENDEFRAHLKKCAAAIAKAESGR